jgi:hypothetical protein
MVWILLAQRAARSLGSLYAHANEMTMEQAGRVHADWTPRGWMKTEKELLIFEQHLYLRQPGYGTSDATGKYLLERTLAEVALDITTEDDRDRRPGGWAVRRGHPPGRVPPARHGRRQGDTTSARRDRRRAVLLPGPSQAEVSSGPPSAAPPQPNTAEPRCCQPSASSRQPRPSASLLLDLAAKGVEHGPDLVEFGTQRRDLLFGGVLQIASEQQAVVDLAHRALGDAEVTCEGALLRAHRIIRKVPKTYRYQ